jgi:antitoxin component of RelBE/YafQ-DinJ toxin-antitoxin module
LTPPIHLTGIVTMATSVRIPDVLKAQATAYADRLGISLNALIAVALNDYLHHRGTVIEGGMIERPVEVAAPAVGATVQTAASESAPSPKPESALGSTQRNQGPNKPCACGSGRKYKACCGRRF